MTPPARSEPRPLRHELPRIALRFVAIAFTIGLLHLQGHTVADAARDGISYSLVFTGAWVCADIVFERLVPRFVAAVRAHRHR